MLGNLCIVYIKGSFVRSYGACGGDFTAFRREYSRNQRIYRKMETGVESILKSMENVQGGMEKLSSVLNENTEVKA